MLECIDLRLSARLLVTIAGLALISELAPVHRFLIGKFLRS